MTRIVRLLPEMMRLTFAASGPRSHAKLASGLFEAVLQAANNGSLLLRNGRHASGAADLGSRNHDAHDLLSQFEQASEFAARQQSDTFVDQSGRRMFVNTEAFYHRVLQWLDLPFDKPSPTWQDGGEMSSFGLPVADARPLLDGTLCFVNLYYSGCLRHGEGGCGELLSSAAKESLAQRFAAGLCSRNEHPSFGANRCTAVQTVAPPEQPVQDDSCDDNRTLVGSSQPAMAMTVAASAPLLCCCEFYTQCAYLRSFLHEVGQRVVCIKEATSAEVRAAVALACGHQSGGGLIANDALRSLGFYDGRKTSRSTFIHLGDEGAPRAFTSDADYFGHVSLYSYWRKVFRQYWSPFFERRDISEWTPLGWALPMASRVPHAARRNFVGFYGMAGNNARRAELMRQFERATGVHVAGSLAEHVACSSTPDACSEEQRAAYVAQMQDTKLCLQLPGLSPECHRLYESLEVGCVPILIDDFHPQMSIQHGPLLGGGPAPFLHAARAEDLAGRLRLLAANPAALAEMHEKTETWWRLRREHFRTRLLQEIQASTALSDLRLPDDSVQPNCAALVPKPMDPSPIRSPQAVHSVLAARMRGREMVEIGTRNGDGIACFSFFARSAIAIEMDERYCVKLRRRAKGAFSVACGSYAHTTPDADVYTWW